MTQAACSPLVPRSRPCSWPTTTWPSACCAPWPRRGGPCPATFSVVGFDDIPESGYLIPPLTTVRQDFTAVGRLAIDTLQVAMRPGSADADDYGVSSRRGRLIRPELILRASTAPAPGGKP